MPSLDRRFAEMRARAMTQPMTRADRFPGVSIDLPGGIAIMLSVNK